MTRPASTTWLVGTLVTSSSSRPLGLLQCLGSSVRAARDLHRGATPEEDVRFQLEEQVGLLVGRGSGPRRRRRSAAGGCRLASGRCVSAFHTDWLHGVDVALVDPQVAVLLVLLVEGADGREVDERVVGARGRLLGSSRRGLRRPCCPRGGGTSRRARGWRSSARRPPCPWTATGSPAEPGSSRRSCERRRRGSPSSRRR